MVLFIYFQFDILSDYRSGGALTISTFGKYQSLGEAKHAASRGFLATARLVFAWLWVTVCCIYRFPMTGPPFCTKICIHEKSKTSRTRRNIVWMIFVQISCEFATQATSGHQCCAPSRIKFCNAYRFTNHCYLRLVGVFHLIFSKWAPHLPASQLICTKNDSMASEHTRQNCLTVDSAYATTLHRCPRTLQSAFTVCYQQIQHVCTCDVRAELIMKCLVQICT